MDKIVRDSLYPVLLGSDTLCHACVRRLKKEYGLPITVLTGKRAMTLRFISGVLLYNAPPTFSDGILLSILSDLEENSGYRIPLLVLCDEAYRPFVTRNREVLEEKFILRDAKAILGLWEDNGEL